MRRIKIAVAYHKKAVYADGEIFVPVQVGAVYTQDDLGIQKDSEGANISRFNPYCCELSATYWLWRNISDADYYGLCHYRRFFTFEKGYSNLIQQIVYYCSKAISPFIVDSRFTMSKSNSISIDENELNIHLREFSKNLTVCLKQYNVDCFCLKKTKMSTYSCKTKLMKAIGLYNYNKLEEIIKSEHPDFYPFFIKTMKSNSYNPCNMLIASKDVFNEYAELLFSIIGRYHNWIINTDSNFINNAALRSSGYMGEFITSAFIMRLRNNGLIVKELNTLGVSIASTGLSQTTGGLYNRIKILLTGGGNSSVIIILQPALEERRAA